MIIKEFRIIMPMTVEEYQIGQLYTIQKKSRIESVGAGSGVEIIENKPFEENNEKGQYTLKVYHVDERLPASLKTVTKLLFPKSALLFEEESWNSYPYTRTKYRHKLFKSFNIDIESKYLSDCGESENTFNLNKSELSMRMVDFIDIVNDPVNTNEYKSEEDPSLFEPVHNKNRGPLLPQWITNLKASATSVTKKKQYMCCYKLCRIECAFWGCQSRVEKSISDSVLRNMLLVTHRQAWTWQDEYFNLTMEDVRRLEAETKRICEMKMNEDADASGEITPLELPNSSSQLTMSNSHNSSILHIERLEIDTSESNEKASDMKKLDSENSMKSFTSLYFSEESQNGKKDSESPTNNNKRRENCEYEFGDLGRRHNPKDELEFNLKLLDDNNENYDILSQNSNNIDEFYDAISQASFNYSTQSNELKLHKRKKLIKLNSITDSESSAEYALDSNLKTDRYKSIKSIQSETNIANNEIPFENNFKSKLVANEMSTIHKVSTNESLISQMSRLPPTLIDTLILVVHGGNVTCTDTSKKSDFLNFKSTMESVIHSHYTDFMDHIAYRLVACENVCKEALLKLTSCSPVVCNQSPGWNDEHEFAETSAEAFALHENLPFSTIPLLISANSQKWQESVMQMTRECNRVYQDFLASCPCFQGRVVIIGDSIGALLVYDALSNPSNVNNGNLSSASSFSNLPNSGRSPYSANSNSPSPILTRKSGNDRPQINISISNLSDSDRFPIEESVVSNSSTLVQRCNSSGADSNNSSALENLSNNSFLTPQKSYLTAGSNSMMVEERFDFDVSHFFVFGSPLGLVLTYRKLAHRTLDPPICTQMYNLFHLTDPCAIRVEPLLCKQFGYIPPCMIPRYSKFPLGDGYNLSLDHFIVKHGNLFDLSSFENQSVPTNRRYNNEVSNDPLQVKSLHKIIQMKKNWWGDNRLDYILYAPEKIANLPKKSLPYLFHSCFWESTDVSAFILRMLTRQDNYHLSNQINSGTDSGSVKKDQGPALEIQKWQRKFNRVKVLRNFSPNHRSNDVIVNEDKEQVLSAKFLYGPLDFVLAGEKVDIFIMRDLAGTVGKQQNNEWEFLASDVTDNHGKVIYAIPENKRLPLGMYQVKMVVKCDHSCAEFYMAVMPAHTEAVVFSIDGSFAANISISGTDPKVRAGAVDVVRHWQDLGFLIIYVTARPDMQHYKVKNWLSQHNFPHGMVFFSQLRHDPMKQKTETLRNLVINNNLKLQAAYGSPKDVAMYSSLGVMPNRIFIIAKALKSKYTYSATLLKDGYASHLASLKSPNGESRQASGNARLILRRTTFNIKQNPIFCTGNNNDQSLDSQLSVNSVISDTPSSPHSTQSSIHSVPSKASLGLGTQHSPVTTYPDKTKTGTLGVNMNSLTDSRHSFKSKQRNSTK